MLSGSKHSLFLAPVCFLLLSLLTLFGTRFIYLSFLFFLFSWVMMGDDKMNADFLSSSSGLQIVSVRFRPVMDLQKQTPRVLQPWLRALGFPCNLFELKGLKLCLTLHLAFVL